MKRFGPNACVLWLQYPSRSRLPSALKVAPSPLQQSPTVGRAPKLEAEPLLKCQRGAPLPGHRLRRFPRGLEPPERSRPSLTVSGLDPVSSRIGSPALDSPFRHLQLAFRFARPSISLRFIFASFRPPFFSPRRPASTTRAFFFFALPYRHSKRHAQHPTTPAASFYSRRAGNPGYIRRAWWQHSPPPLDRLSYLLVSARLPD